MSGSGVRGLSFREWPTALVGVLALFALAFGSMVPAVAASTSSDMVGSGSISGRVVDASGVGISGAVVEVWETGGAQAGEEVSDSSGGFTVESLKAGSYHVSFTPDAGDPQRLVYWADPSESSVNRDGAVSVLDVENTDNAQAGVSSVDAAGVVVLGEGEDRTGLGVVLTDVGTGAADGQSEEEPTPADEGTESGTVVVEPETSDSGVDADEPERKQIRTEPESGPKANDNGRFGGQSESAPHGAAAKDSGPMAAELGANNENRPSVDASTLATSASGSITGKVTDSSGNAVADAYVWADSDDSAEYAYTDSKGVYTITGLAAGSYTVRFEGPYGVNLAQQFYKNASSSDKATKVSVSAGKTSSGIDAVLVAGGSITGKVTDSSGKAVADAYVGADSGDGWGSGSYTDSKGVYTITGLSAGSYVVSFGAPDGVSLVSQYYKNASSSDKATKVSVSAGKTSSGIDAVLVAGGSITGKVTDSSGKAVADAYVWADSGDGWGSGSYTDSKGVYTITGLAAGSYVVSFDAPDGVSLVSQYYKNASSSDKATKVSVSAGKTSSGIDAVLVAGGSITGKVTDSSGKAVADAYVWADSDDSAEYAYTDSKGVYTITGLSAGSYTVGFEGPYGVNLAQQFYKNASSSDKATKVSVSAGKTSSGIDAVLVAGGSITGKVTDSSGKAVADANVWADSGDGWGSVFYTDSKGVYTITGLSAGSYTVFFDGPYGVNLVPQYYKNAPTIDKATKVSVSPGKTSSGVDAALVKGATISGTIKGASIDALSRLAITVLWKDSGAYAGSTGVNSNGSFSVEGLAAGDYVVRAQDFDGLGGFFGGVTRGTATTITISAGQTVSGTDITVAKGVKISGNISTTVSPVPLWSTGITAYRWDGKSWEDVTEISGWSSYTISGETGTWLPAGTYKVGFSAPDGLDPGVVYPYAVQFWSGQNSLAQASSFTLKAGESKSGVNATLVKKTSQSFTDVPSSQPFFSQIEWMKASGITTGYSDGTYRPLGTVTRDAMAAFLYRAAGSPAFTPPSKSPFSDVKITSPFYKEITWLASTGISTGWKESGGKVTYRPTANITRDAMSAFLYRAAKSPGFSAPSSPSFGDVPRSQPFYREIEWMKNAGISTGWSEGGGKVTYRPTQNITRDAMAAFLNRASSLIRDKW